MDWCIVQTVTDVVQDDAFINRFKDDTEKPLILHELGSEWIVCYRVDDSSNNDAIDIRSSFPSVVKKFFPLTNKLEWAKQSVSNWCPPDMDD